MIGKFFRKEPDNPKVPQGQSVTDRFPVLTYGPTPRVTEEEIERMKAEAEANAEAAIDPGGHLVVTIARQGHLRRQFEDEPFPPHLLAIVYSHVAFLQTVRGRSMKCVVP